MNWLKQILSLLSGRERRQFGIFVVTDFFISLLDIASLALLVIAVLEPDSFPGVLSTGAHPLFLLLGIFIVRNLFSWLVFRARYNFVYNVASRISGELLLDYFNREYTEFTGIDSSVHTRRISQQPVEFAHYVLAGMLQLITQSLLAATALTAMLLYNAQLFLLLTVMLLPPVLLLYFIIQRRTGLLRKQSRSAGAKGLGRLKEALAGYVEANIFSRQQFFLKRYLQQQEIWNKLLAGLHVIQSTPARFMEVFLVAGLLLLAVLPGNGSSQITLAAFMAAAYRVIPAVVKIINAWAQINTYSFTLRELASRTEKKIDADDTASGIENISASGICFRYNGRAVLSQLDLQLNSGEILGIHGSSGKGKTTLVNLLLGFLEEQSGSFSLNGKPVRSSDRKNWWARIAYVPQQPFLLHASLKENISLMKDDIDEGRLYEAMTASGLAPIFGDNGAVSHISENGRNISGGQRQRIGLARALYRDADLVILDEPFSELDEKSSIELTATMKEISARGKMIMILTHQKEVLAHCTKTLEIV